MGCCEARLQSNQASAGFINLTEPDENFEFCLNHEPFFLDPRAIEIEKYANQLIYSSDWNFHIEHNEYSIKTKSGSIFNETSPVFLVVLDLSVKVPLHSILNLLFSPRSRLSWDNTLEFMEILSKDDNTIRIIRKYPIKPLEIVFKVKCIKSKNTAVAVYWSEDDYTVDENFNKKMCYFGMVRVTKSKSGISALVIQQDDFEKGVTEDRQGILASDVMQWMLVLKKNIVKA